MHNKAFQSDSARAVRLCAARSSLYIAHKRPAHALRLKAALYPKTDMEY